MSITITVDPLGKVYVGTNNPAEAEKLLAAIEELKKAGITVTRIGEVEQHKHDDERVLRDTQVKS